MKVRRFLVLAAVLLFAAVLLPKSALAAGCPGSEDGKHHWTSWECGEGPDGTPCEEPTCTKAGRQVRFCQYCEACEYRTVAALGHNWKWTVVKKATCTAKGQQKGVCTRCGAATTKTIKALGHKWGSWTVSKKATCTEEGSQYRVCSRCKIRTTQIIAALGHQWDDGKVTQEPQGFTPGVKTYTCLHDASHTHTEAIQPGISLFLNLRDLPPEAANADPLVVTQQPKNGLLPVSGGMGHTMTVAVTGGVAPYTYQWYYRDDSLKDRQSLGIGRWQSNLTDLVNAYRSGRDSNASRIAAGLKDLHRVAYRLSGNVQRSPIRHGLSLSWHAVADAQTDTCFAPGGGYSYCCVITDSAGNSVTSDVAEVLCELHIVKQPANINLAAAGAGGKLQVFAEGGSERFTYHWFYVEQEGNANVTVDETVNYLVPPKDGQYYAVVLDSEYNDRVTSNIVTVYHAEPLSIELEPGVYMPYGGSVTLEAKVTGGVAPYWGAWYLGDTLLKEAAGYADADLKFTVPVTASDFGQYRFVCCDVFEACAASTVAVIDDGMRMEEWLTGGVLSVDGMAPVYLKVSMAKGTPPFRFTLFKDDVELVFAENDKGYRFRAWTAGEYFIRIEDRFGNTMDSNRVLVTEPDSIQPRIIQSPVNTTATVDPETGASRAVLCCRASAADGRNEYLQYVWEIKLPAGWLSGSPSSGTLELNAVSNVVTWRCVVTDLRTGAQAISSEATTRPNGAAEELYRKIQKCETNLKYYQSRLKNATAIRETMEYTNLTTDGAFETNMKELDAIIEELRQIVADLEQQLSELRSQWDAL